VSGGATVREPVAARAPAATPPSGRRSRRALIRRGLRDQAHAPLTWGGGLGAMSALVAALWPSIEGSMGDLMRDYPETLKQAFGIESSTRSRPTSTPRC
jgi:ABC-2 type transport system permease protein